MLMNVSIPFISGLVFDVRYDGKMVRIELFQSLLFQGWFLTSTTYANVRNDFVSIPFISGLVFDEEGPVVNVRYDGFQSLLFQGWFLTSIPLRGL